MTPALGDLREFALGDLPLERGGVLRDARLRYRVAGHPAADNVVLLPSWFTGTSADYAPWVGPGRALDTQRWCVVATDLFGNGVSTSPSDGGFGGQPGSPSGAFPLVTIADNVRAQRRLLTSRGVERPRLVAGWSMGAMQALAWGALFPASVGAVLAVAGTAGCEPYNAVFLDGLLAVLDGGAAGRGEGGPDSAASRLGAFGRVYAGWAYSEEFFAREAWRSLGYSSQAELLASWARDHAAMDARNLRAMLETWRSAPPSPHSPPPSPSPPASQPGNGAAPPTLLLPSRTDRYFSPAAAQATCAAIPGARLEVIDSDLGHMAGRPGIRAAEDARVAAAIRQMLGD